MSGFMAFLGLPTSRPNGNSGPSTVQRTHRAAKFTTSSSGLTRGQPGSGKVDRSASMLKHDFSHLRVGAERRQAAAEVDRLRGLTPEQRLSDVSLSAKRMAAAVAETGRDRRF